MKKTRRFLPAGVSRYKDRHGRWRYRYRRVGHPGGHFTSEFGSPEWLAELAEFEKPREGAAPPKKEVAGSIGDLVRRYMAVPTRLGPTAVTQGKIRSVLGRFKDDHGHRMVADFTFEHIDKLIERAGVKDTVQTARGPRPIGGLHAATKLRKELVRLFDFAIKLKMRPDNPASQSDKVKRPVGEDKGYHSWTEAEIAQYRARHPLGSRARLAMELMLWTGQRRSDARTMGPADIVDGRIVVEQGKTGKTLGLAVAPRLLEAITAMPHVDDAPAYLLTNRGKPFSRAGFGNKMREWCDQADLPQCSAHGLRKAIMRRMAELDMGNQTLKAVSGHSRDEEVALYTKAANQKTMADDAIHRLSAWEASNRLLESCLTSPQPPVTEA
ncbi:tyrosine-type recombinase/integrase [Sphingomonas sp. 1P08PE]|uniref:tyrosine-type recombinase/integrase n=1 Tax=Sphingomonas sp. 1P08PE TaxID=554122 RepID=UPI00399F5142